MYLLKHHVKRLVSLLHFFSSTVLFKSQVESPVSHGCIQSLLLKFSAQEFIEVRQLTNNTSSSSMSTLVISVDHTKLWAMTSSSTPQPQKCGVKRKGDGIIHPKRAPGSSPSRQTASVPSSTSSITLASSLQLPGASDWKSGSGAVGVEKKGRTIKQKTSHVDMEIENLLNQQSTKEQQSKKVPIYILSCYLFVRINHKYRAYD